MPNLLQKRTYNSENQRQYSNRIPNENMILNFARQLTDELFIKDDTEIYNYLMRAKCKSEFDFGDLVGEEIHPLTIVIDDYRFCKVIPTISLFDKI